MADLPSSFRLNTGANVPAVGLGTFQADGDDAKRTVKLALQLGYRHIDCANGYGNEKEVGEALRESGIPREELFITSKLEQTWHEPADVGQALDESLRDLQVDYVDLYLMHFPYAYKGGRNHETLRHPSGNGKPIIDYAMSRRYPETWQAMEKLVESGKARAIGVSNFNILKLKRILAVANIPPAVDQVEMHPYFPQDDLLQFCRDQGIVLMAHQPLGGRPAAKVRAHADSQQPPEDPEIVDIASRNAMTPAQVCLSWAVQRGIPVVPKAAQELHLRDNLSVKKLPVDDFQAINTLASRNGGPKRFLDPKEYLGFDVFDEEHDQPVADAAPWDAPQQ